MKPETFIKKTTNGHTVYFRIGVQTFSIGEYGRETETYGSLANARWHKKMLDKAFNNLNK